jgi:branched-chain amino acid transport system substrate-binding protein
MRRTVPAALAACLIAAGPAAAQAPKVKIGFVGTFSGPNAIIGQDKKEAFELALDHLGRKMGGLDIEVTYEDDQMKPEVGKQVTEKLIQVQKVDFLTGYNWSNVLLASLKPAVDSRTFFISANAGPSQVAGELCSPFFFSTSWQNDQTPQAMGEYLNRRGVKRVFLLAPNYAAGKDMAAGVKSTFKGEVVGEEYTRWPGQVDFSTELSKIRSVKPDAVWVFYPGQAGVQFVQQYTNAGLKESVPLYSVFTVDAITLPQLKEIGLGHRSTQQWVQDIDTEANKRFVSDFRKKYGRYPSYYAAQTYDAAMLIASAVTAVKGNLTDKDAIRDAMRKADFKSVRGDFKFNNNHFPIQDFWLQEVVKDENGDYTNRKVEVVLDDHKDAYHTKCSMKW